jgi:hypothetical protein
MSAQPHHESESNPPREISLPAPTAWPIVLAFGVSLIFAGLVTTAAVSILGAFFAGAASIGWFREVLPHERHETVRVVTAAVPVVTTRRAVSHIPVAPELQRAFLPLEIYPVSAGVKGGLAGSVAMAIVAIAYGIISHGSVWYPINLLAAVVYARALEVTTAQMEAFHLPLLLLAIVLHLTTSVLVGLLYGAMLPMFPKRPILLGGFIAPLLWSGLLYNMLGTINPVLSARIHWGWFVASQFAFGIVAGIIVSRQTKVRILQNFPFAVLAGIETPGTIEEKGGGEE